jgi:hypothetical protein
LDLYPLRPKSTGADTARKGHQRQDRPGRFYFTLFIYLGLATERHSDSTKNRHPPDSRSGAGTCIPHTAFPTHALSSQPVTSQWPGPRSISAKSRGCRGSWTPSQGKLNARPQGTGNLEGLVPPPGKRAFLAMPSRGSCQSPRGGGDCEEIRAPPWGFEKAVRPFAAAVAAVLVSCLPQKPKLCNSSTSPSPSRPPRSPRASGPARRRLRMLGS